MKFGLAGRLEVRSLQPPDCSVRPWCCTGAQFWPCRAHFLGGWRGSKGLPVARIDGTGTLAGVCRRASNRQATARAAGWARQSRPCSSRPRAGSSARQPAIIRARSNAFKSPQRPTTAHSRFPSLISPKFHDFSSPNQAPARSAPDRGRLSMAGAEAVERAHELYRGGRHREALELYSAALAAARGPAQRIALHSNRAACYLKLHDFHKAAEECTSVLELDTEHTGALMLRAQTLVTLKDYQSALFDVNRLIEINPSSEVYRNLHARLKTQLSLAPIPESEEESLYTEEDKEDLTPKENTKNETVVVKSDQPSAKLILENKPVTKALKVEVPPNLPSKPEGGVTVQKPKGHSELDYKKPLTEAPKVQVSPSLPSKPECWGTIQKPKGHSGLDYSKWDKVEDDSSEDDEDDDEDDLPRYKFKVRTIGVRTVK
ncbi:uncharacterized protein [Triticum aestivum]|nr:uncharacterized protein LOC123039346 [Triticum aestivum]